MTDQEILRELTTIIQDVLGDEALVIGPDTTADTVEGWDSFNHINIVAATEMHFAVKFQTGELESLHSVGHLVALVGRKLAQKGR